MPKVILLIAMAYAVLTQISQTVQIKDAQCVRDGLAEQRAQLVQDVAELSAIDEQNALQFARDGLGMAESGETILYYKP